MLVLVLAVVVVVVLWILLVLLVLLLRLLVTKRLLHVLHRMFALRMTVLLVAQRLLMMRLVHGRRTRTALRCVLANQVRQRIAFHGPRRVLVRVRRT